MLRRIALMLVTGALVTTVSVCQGEVMVTGASHDAWTEVNSAPNSASDTDSTSSTTRPLSTLLSAQATLGNVGIGSATNLVSRSETNGGYLLQSNATLGATLAPGDGNIYAETFGYEAFTATTSTPYSLTGWLDVEPGYRGSITASLFDVTANTWVFSVQNYKEGGDILLELGKPVGTSFLQGNLTGLLIAGHQYEFAFVQHIEGRGGDDFQATGQVALLLGTTEVPEPASLAMWGLVAAAGSVIGYRRRQLRAQQAP